MLGRYEIVKVGFVCYPTTKVGFILYETVRFKHVHQQVIEFVLKVNDAVYLNYTRRDDGCFPNFPTLLFHFPYGDLHFKLLSFNTSFRQNYIKVVP